MTVKAFEQIKLDFYVVIEKQEYTEYSKHIDKDKILVLPFSNKGLVPTRNWIRSHAEKSGAKYHWQVDDNIAGFVRLNRNKKIKVTSGTIFKVMEDFVERYENIAIAGPNYDFFAKRKQKIPPFYLNTRIYSCSLINHAMPFYHRGVFNDDTDICLRALKAGWCTIQFNAFLQQKAQTMTISGGLNTEEYYKQQDGRLKFAKELADRHPDVVTITRKFNRWHHHVNYKPFARNKLIKKPDIIIPQGINNYGMELRTFE
jgi:hypothetical protein